MKRKLFIVLFGIGLLTSLCYAITEKFTMGNDYMVIYAPIELADKDFEGSGFFVPKNKVGNDQNVEIFRSMKTLIQSGRKTGVDNPTIKKSLKKKQGELVTITTNIAEDGKIWYAIYDKKKRNFVSYEFQLDVDWDAYTQLYNKAAAEYDKYLDAVADCNRTIENCSSPTVKQWKTKQVPYQAQVPYTVSIPYEAEVPYEVRVPYTEYVSDWIPGGSGQPGSVEYVPVTRYRTEIRYRTETQYRNETRYRTETQYRTESESYEVSNSQYDPKKVAKAKEELEQLQVAMASLDVKMQDIHPFSVR